MQSTDRFQRDRGPLNFSTGTAAISRRGWQEFCPRQLEVDKLIISLVMHAGATSAEINASQAVMVTDYSAAVSRRARRFIWESFPLLVLPYGIDLFWELIFALDQPTVLCHVASGKPDFDSAWRKGASTLADINPQQAIDYFSNRFSQWTWQTGKPLLFEETPGKTRLLELEGRSERGWAKFSKGFQKASPSVWQEQNETIFQRSGWGLHAMSIDPEKTGSTVRQRTVELDPTDFGLGFGRGVAREIHAWIEELKLSQVDAFVSTAPSLAMNAELEKYLDKPVEMPDVQYGWNPVQSILSAMTKPRGHSIIVALGPFPLINLVYVGHTDG